MKQKYEDEKLARKQQYDQEKAARKERYEADKKALQAQKLDKDLNKRRSDELKAQYDSDMAGMKAAMSRRSWRRSRSLSVLPSRLRRWVPARV
ncbi:hypothetical protein [Gordonia westfalica]|uniref:Uncharacterized protein n=1 Tax=Gordonia westfalica TaxID=158898 RepID=A0A1H2EG99_9ACTN|nr:hypothetical protein [Gordonia westfalica]SDT94111.1 hypothetical protein SAMN04488548_13112 [Gordonia westfalica]